MEQVSSSEQKENHPKDISNEFMTMDMMDFLDFLFSQRKEPELSIVIDWQGVNSARRIKSFLESRAEGQKRFATIRATEAQHQEEMNVFASGVKWEKIEE